MASDADTYTELRRVITAMIGDLRRSGDVPGIDVGEAAPGFALTNATGRIVALADHLARGPIVVVFYRGAWCPYCDTHLRGLQRVLPSLQRLGASLVAISPQAPDASLTLAERLVLGFDVLSDADQAVTAAWRLRFELPAEVRDIYRSMGLDLEEQNADGSWSLPVPGTFILDSSGIVRARHVDANYLERMDPDAVVAAVEALA